jgi:hypothetical protein
MFTSADRERIRAEILDAARDDARLSGGAVTGSAASGGEDSWSDIDLAFGVAEPARMADVLADWTARLYERYEAVHHFDVRAGAWIYRVFLLANTLQIDLAFAPANEFGARAPTFRLVFGRATELPHVTPGPVVDAIGYAWLYALHVRSSLARGKLWQAEYMVSAMRDQVLALACLRLGLPAREGRGMDALPGDVTAPLAEALVGRLDRSEIARAFRATTLVLLAETRQVDASLARRLEPTLLAMSGDPVTAKGVIGRSETLPARLRSTVQFPPAKPWEE